MERMFLNGFLVIKDQIPLSDRADVEVSVDEETDAMEFQGDVLETDTADTEPGEIAETTADPEIEEYIEEEAVVETELRSLSSPPLDAADDELVEVMLLQYT